MTVTQLKGQVEKLSDYIKPIVALDTSRQSTLFDTLMEVLHGIPHTTSTTTRKGLHAAAEPPSLEGVSILLVEDNPVNQQVALELLESAGANVTRSGLQARIHAVNLHQEG